MAQVFGKARTRLIHSAIFVIFAVACMVVMGVHKNVRYPLSDYTRGNMTGEEVL